AAARRLCQRGFIYDRLRRGLHRRAVCRAPSRAGALKMTESARIAHDEDAIRVDRWFKRHYPALNHGRLEKLLRTGQVRLDGKRVKSADRVAAGQTGRLPPQITQGDLEENPARPKPPERMSGNLQDHILYMDKSVIVLNKPPGLAT